MENKRVLMTGGHAGTTALSVVEALQKADDTKGWSIFWVGAERAVEGKNIPTLESQTLPKLGVKTYPIKTGRLQRKFTLYTIPSLLMIPFGFLHAATILLTIKPHIIVSFGGYAAFPVVLVGWAFGIPVIIHEQTAAAGRSNIYASFFARKIALARESSKDYFTKAKCIVVGNPVTSDYFNVKPKMKISNPPVLLITGGSRGSTPINDIIVQNISWLTETYHVIHQTGELDFHKINAVREGLSDSHKKQYEVYSFVSPNIMSELFNKADVIIARAGANTVSQVLIAKRPTLFIPLPFAHNDEQTKNARFAKEFGVAEILPQNELTGDTLKMHLENILTRWTDMVHEAKDKKSPDSEAANRMVSLIRSLL
jgi:UDP-N-acetylglucosamine--N-acetylmuramyl-(pentapeptide) pyrophosphoryl-undecaprenol N-acetylglucosamine transferase